MSEEKTEVKKPVLIMDRVKELEELTNGLAGYTQKEVEALKAGVAQMVEFLQALVQVTGQETAVQAQIKANRLKRDTERAERDQKMIASLVEAGVLVATESVTEKSILVGREFNKEGELLGGGRAQVPFSQFGEDMKSKVLGQGIGFVLEAPEGRFEVVEIYEQAAPKLPQVAPAAEVVDATPANPSESTTVAAQ